jgi:ubiquinol oxidase
MIQTDDEAVLAPSLQRGAPLPEFGLADPSAPTSSSLLRWAEGRTLSEPARPHGILARSLFSVMDFVYGRRGSLQKFVVLELVARVPYQAWENVAYVAISHTAKTPRFGRRIFEFAREARAQQDNEQWHLFILEELAARRRRGSSWLLHRALPQLLAFVYYHVSWLLYVVRPRLSYELNADFEDHAERSYMRYTREHPELETEPWHSAYAGDYGAYESVADVLRRIALDERTHRLECVAHFEDPRFSLHPAARST